MKSSHLKTTQKQYTHTQNTGKFLVYTKDNSVRDQTYNCCNIFLMLYQKCKASFKFFGTNCFLFPFSHLKFLLFWAMPSA